MPPLEKRDIHLWLLFSDEMTSEPLHAHYFSLLSAQELQQQKRFCFAEDRLRYLLTRALVRTVLSRYAPIVPREWRFATNSYGRPHIANPLPAGADLRFNLSHTRGLIVLAVTQARDIGVDVENTRSRVVSTEIAARFFSRAEADALSRLPPQQRQERFLEYWTFKESYIKARGMGLSIPLDQFSFCYSGERNVQMTTHEALADAPGRWQFWQLRPAPEYCLAVCVQRAGTQASQLLVRKAVPAESEQVIVLPVLRTSE
jgi:4'-phosphopantetheinyl transferase